MTIGEIIDRIKKGESVRIPTSYLSAFTAAVDVMKGSFSCDVDVDGKTTTLGPVGMNRETATREARTEEERT